jgi:hypothetical protein
MSRSAIPAAPRKRPNLPNRTADRPGRVPVMALAAAVRDWLLDSDPALRWHVERDLVGAPQEVWAATRARIATEGFGARLLALQDPDGQWAGGSFFPGDFDFHGPEAAEGAGQLPSGRGPA